MKRSVLALVAVIMAASAGILMGAPLSLITGPQSAPFAGLAAVNTLINSINANLASFITFANTAAEAGEMAFSGAVFVAEGSSTCGSTGISFSECLVIVDNAGRAGFIGVQYH